MLRRRSKSPRTSPHGTRSRPEIPKHRGEGEAARRRRARPDVEVPPELKLKVPVSSFKPPEPAPRGSSRDVVLVTGFEPFGGDKANPSWDICTQLPAEIAGMRVETCRVPCEFRRSIEVVAAAIERHQPTLVLCLGLAAGRNRLGVERVAINVDDARIPDNARAQPIDELIAANGPPAYFATLPVKAMTAGIRAAGVPVEVSNSAGTYVCNHLMYGVLHYLAESGQRARAGFIHVPYAERQVLDRRDMPSMSLASMVKGVAAAIAAAQAHRHDIEASEGALS
jgi:pyroglutamyl-peptidase